MNWGQWIIFSFIAFAVFIASLVYVCVIQDLNLVSKDYYQEELSYQEQIDRIENTRTLSDLPSITIEDGFLKISFSDLPKITSGTINLFRPSDADLDQKFSITKTENTSMQFRLATLAKGLYKARVTWEMGDKEYYYEKIVIL